MVGKKQKNKFDRRGWLRVVEAFLAVLIVFGTVLIILSNQEQRADISQGVYEQQRYILELISKNNSLRAEVISGNNEEINKTIQSLIPSSWNFVTRICGLDEICSNPGIYENKEVYATEVLITSTLTQYAPKKLRLFVWMK